MKGLMVQIRIIISLDGNQKKVKEKRKDVEGQRSIGEGFCPRRLLFAREAERTIVLFVYAGLAYKLWLKVLLPNSV